LQAGILGANNPDYIEKIARQDLSLQKSGEQVVSFIMSSPSPTPKNDGPVAKPSWFGWLNNLWQAIK
jgi:hypothetical protein